MKEHRAKPCPWCGDVPNKITHVFGAFKDINSNYEKNTEMYKLICNNSHCAIHSSTEYYNDILIAIEVWNRRSGGGRII